jgi:malate synthase
MTVPFMRAYTELLVRTCHHRGAHAIGGMAAFIPSRKDAAVNETALAKVREDKEREAGDGFDGTWVAHPDLVAVAREPFSRVLGSRPHQKERLREDVTASASSLSDFTIPGGFISETGIRNNISVALRYMESWLNGVGAVGIFNLMEDAATAEISRSQLWQWLHHHGARLQGGAKITEQLYQELMNEEVEKIREEVGDERFQSGKYAEAERILKDIIFTQEFKDFLTLPAYELLD